VAEKIQYLGTGRRKTSVARVRLVPGETGVTINGKDMREYFGGREILAKIVEQPLELTETLQEIQEWLKERNTGKRKQEEVHNSQKDNCICIILYTLGNTGFQGFLFYEILLKLLNIFLTKR